METTYDNGVTSQKRKLITNKRTINDPVTTPKINETYYPDLSERKGSLESLSSFRSFGSQLSVDSSESHGSQENSRTKPVPSTRTRRNEHVTTNVNVNVARTSVSRRTDSSSTGYSDGEIDVDTPNAVQSAPPVFNMTPPFAQDNKFQANVNVSHSPNGDIWRKRTEYSTSYNNYPVMKIKFKFKNSSFNDS